MDDRLIDSTSLKPSKGRYSAEAQYLFWKVEYQRRNPLFYDFFENMIEATKNVDGTREEPFKDSQEILRKIIEGWVPEIPRILPFEFYGSDKHLIKWRIGDPVFEVKKIESRRTFIELKDPTQTGETLHIENVTSLSGKQLTRIFRQINTKIQAYREFKDLSLKSQDKIKKKEFFDLATDYDFTGECSLAKEGAVFDPTAYMAKDEISPREESVLSRACGLWLWDYRKKNECSKALAIRTLRETFNFKDYPPDNGGRERRLERYIHSTDKCIEADAVLSFR